MEKHFEYTTLAQRYTARFPLLTYVGTQANFWILANLLLAAVLSLHARLLSQVLHLPVAGTIGPPLLTAVVLGLVWGVALGLMGYHLDRRISRSLSLGQELLAKALGSVALIALLVGLLELILVDSALVPALLLPGMALNGQAAKYLFGLLLLYYSFMSLVISFINQIHKKYGPGVLVPLLLGRYRDPQEEERIFLFMDLQSSTATAEALGHRQYSAFIRDCFADINEVLFPFEAQVYQYVGDEIVVMWPTSEGVRNHACIRFFFACQNQFRQRAAHYQTTYGCLPHFKAGIHAGDVSAVEIGEIKKDIAYHGDTLNTAARIQSVCNHYQAEFLASEHLLGKMAPDPHLNAQSLGMVQLRGKAEKIGLVRVDWQE
ncbi:adenylate/guanylate cyclase domain-containing protein [Hymenobacter cellulosivorans]|uniref:Adenylate/guanylate cyclase domain-containing protein n=1 Tax=Hymenobacter cellulosivorans TaxID=2932249 RepID=A0ABY4F993_9BACT|nr:adenylate/guanylate cyclase domain-containing protein [Hymenobacter cellulosivorans]UOQ52771.1 adenylate/guanylate cyclase domain-containing protein [Hymenobacter cellulosivorans]